MPALDNKSEVPVLAVMALAIMGLVAIISVSQPTCAAGPWYVAPGGDDSNDCLSPAGACATINGAIAKASPGDTIYVATGTYTGTGNEVVLLDKDVTLSGGWNSVFTTQSGTSTIDGQSARRGMTVNGGVTTVIESFTVQNGVNYGCGGISNDGTMTLNNSTVSGNTGLAHMWIGGGGVCNRGIMNLNNSTISNNTSHYIGGGIYIQGGTVTTMNNCTVSDNTAGLYGGGIGVEVEWPIVWYTVTLQNTIVAGNTARGSYSDCSGITSAGYNLIGNTSGCGFTPSTGDLTNVDAHLGPLIGVPGAPRYHPLLSGSPAIDAGNPAGCMGSTGPLTTDQRGVGRVGRCDIGAYEYTIPGPAASIDAFGGTPQHTPPLGTYVTPLQAAVLDSIGSPVSNTIVNFSAPASGASGTFTDTGSYTTTATTIENGIATAATFIANGLDGSYMVTATVGGVATTANFLLTNIQWWVAPGGDDSNDCLSPNTACATINGVLSKPSIGLVAGDTIRVATGTYTGTGNEVVLLNKNVTLSGGWNSAFTTQSGTSTIDGQDWRSGVTVNSGVTAIIERFTVQNGSGYEYGGIHNDGTLTLNNSTVSGNTAGDAGGIYNYEGTLTLNNSTVSGNRRAGILNHGILILNNSTISSNTGGGVYNESGTVTLNSSTISGNSQHDWYGGGILGSGSTTLRNTIVAGNTATYGDPDCYSVINSAGYNLIGNTSGCYFTPGPGDLTNVDPKLGPLEGAPGYHPLLPGSPAINAGNPAGCTDNLGNLLTTDQRGAPRVGRCDIGAYEASLFAAKEVTGTFEPGGLVTYTIALANLGGSIDLTNVLVTDTLPVPLTYVANSYSATGGTGGESGGVITWSGTVFSDTQTVITFGATISDVAPRSIVTNTAVSKWGVVTVTGKAVFDTLLRIYLPIVVRNLSWSVW